MENIPPNEDEGERRGEKRGDVNDCKPVVTTARDAEATKMDQERSNTDAATPGRARKGGVPEKPTGVTQAAINRVNDPPA